MEVVVDDAIGLHQGVTGCRPHKSPPQFFKCFTHSLRLWCLSPHRGEVTDAFVSIWFVTPEKTG